MLKRLLAAVLLVAGLALPAPAQNLSPDLALLPSDTVVFVHLRVSDLWKHDLFKGVKETIAAAGPKALAAFESQVYPNPADLERATLVLRINSQNPNGPPDVTGLLTFKNDVSADKIRELYKPPQDVDVQSVGGKHLLIGPPASNASFLAKGPGKGEGALAALIAQAPTKTLTIAANVKAMPIPPNAFDQIPPEIRPLAMVERVLLTVDLNAAEPAIELRASYANEAAATDAEKSLKAAVAMGKQAMGKGRAELEKMLYENANKGPQPLETAGKAGVALVGLGAMNQLDQFLDKVPVTRSGADLTLKVSIPKDLSSMSGAYLGVMAGLLMPAVEKVRGAAERTSSSNNLKQIGIAMHMHHDNMNKMPAAAICDKDGKRLLSWRVAVLPYIEHDDLYKQFKLDERWDSANNKPLIEKMPKIYASPGVKLQPGETVYKAIVGKDAIFDWKEGAKFTQVIDGLSNTIMVAEAGDPVTWTKPDELEFDSAKDLPKLELPGGKKQIQVLYGDGSVRVLQLQTVPKETLKALMTKAGGEVVNTDEPPPGARIAPAPPVANTRPAAPPPPRDPPPVGR